MLTVKILIVEDEQLVADDLREILEALEYTVVGLAASGEDAIKSVERNLPDLILMDIHLAGEMDGIQAAEQIQSRFNVPVVYLTAYADRTTLTRVKATHPFGYIVKPFNESMLSTTIEVALSRHQIESSIRNTLASTETVKRQAEAQSQSKSDLISMVSHELRNPLAVIRFATEILQQQGGQMTLERYHRLLEQIQMAADSLNYLLEDVLTLERTGSEQLECFPSPIEIVGFCQEQMETLKLGTGKVYTLTLSPQADRCTVFLDSKLLWHLLNNLLSNAIKYSPQGGEIQLGVSWDEQTVCLKVQDQGIGIPPDAQPKLFDPFYRADNVGRIPGTGLGLAIARQCVILQGGEIDVESAIGQGTTFRVKLPRKLEGSIEQKPVQ
ncbi:hybrid sensor histidine kinase/response regulator [filamentous cyanobacterium CCP1]|jgi:signal transduction histidine kinase|nr:hybrid sensor histidine kinase/response regulator [filamentous cyanobacterium CCP1]